MRVLSSTTTSCPRDAARFPRWDFRRGRPEQRLESGWRAEGTRFVHAPVGPAADRIDWVEYRHWDPERGRYAPVHDFIAYNGTDVRGENAVTDLAVEARVAPGADAAAVAVRIDSGSDRFVVEIPVGGVGPARSSRGTAGASRSRTPRRGLDAGRAGRGALLEASVMDRRLTVAVDGVPLFDPIDYDDPAVGPGAGRQPGRARGEGGAVALGDVRVYRDVYYTSALAFSPRRPFGVDVAVPARAATSSSCWGTTARCRTTRGSGPGARSCRASCSWASRSWSTCRARSVPLKVFGRSVYWVPDPREIRYIR